MIFELYKKYEGLSKEFTKFDSEGNEIEWNETPVMLWKFKDENGNLWNTETAIDGTEDQAREIILGSMQ